MKIAGKFVSYEETEYVIEGKKVTGRLLNVQIDGTLCAFKGASVHPELDKNVMQQYETGNPVVLDCSLKVRDYNDLNGKKVKVPTIYIEAINED